MARGNPRRGTSTAGAGRAAGSAAEAEQGKGSWEMEAMEAEAVATMHEAAEQGTPASDATQADSPPPEASRDSAPNGNHAAAAAAANGEEQEEEQSPLAGGEAEGDAGLAMEGRPSAQLEKEVAKMLSGMSGEGGAATAQAGLGGSAKPPDPATVDSLEGLPVLPDVVRNKDLKRELPLVCHIVGCGVDLTTQADYYQRYRVCKEHLKSPAMLVDGIPQRFCQQCGRFHELKEFDSDKRNCRARLQQHNSRRRKVFAMSQELKRNKFVKPDSCLIDPVLGDAEAMAAAMAASGAWGALPLPPLPTSSPGGLPHSLPALNGDAGMSFAGLPALPLPLPAVGGEPAPPPLDTAALAAAMAAAGAGLDSGAQPSQRGVKRSHSGLDGGGGELSAGMQRMLQEAARGMGLRPDGGDAAAEGLLPDRQQQQQLGGGRSRKDIDPARLFGLSGSGHGNSQLSNPFTQRSRASPPPSEGGRSGPSGWPPIGPLPAGGAGGQPSSTLLEQMARRVLLSSGGQGGAQRGGQGAAPGPPGGASSWAPPSDVKDHPEAQALAAVYPELAAQIQLLSQQLQAVQAQLAMVMPNPEDSGGGRASTPAAPSAMGGSGLSSRELSLGGAAASPGRATAAPPAARHPPPMFASSGRQPAASKPPPPPAGGGFTAEDLLKAFAAGVQQSNGGPVPSKGGMAGLEDLLARATGLDPPARRTPPPPAAPSSPQHGLPPAAWDMLQALLRQPGAGSPGRGGAGGAGVPARPDAETPSSSAIEQLSAALRAAGDVAVGAGGRSSRGGASDHGSMPIGDMFAFLASVGQGSGRRGP